jgi:hypothetical protein
MIEYALCHSHVLFMCFYVISTHKTRDRLQLHCLHWHVDDEQHVQLADDGQRLLLRHLQRKHAGPYQQFPISHECYQLHVLLRQLPAPEPLWQLHQPSQRSDPVLLRQRRVVID